MRWKHTTGVIWAVVVLALAGPIAAGNTRMASLSSSEKVIDPPSVLH